MKDPRELENELKETNKKIAVYLHEKGRMSLPDICDDLSLEWADVEWAELDGYIREAEPVPGGHGKWFKAVSGVHGKRN